MLETGKPEPEKVQEELTLQNVPKAVNYLINEIAEMRFFWSISKSNWDWVLTSTGR